MSAEPIALEVVRARSATVAAHPYHSLPTLSEPAKETAHARDPRRSKGI